MKGLARNITPPITEGMPRYWSLVGRSRRNIIDRRTGVRTYISAIGDRRLSGILSMQNEKEDIDTAKFTPTKRGYENKFLFVIGPGLFSIRDDGIETSRTTTKTKGMNVNKSILEMASLKKILLMAKAIFIARMINNRLYKNQTPESFSSLNMCDLNY